MPTFSAICWRVRPSVTNRSTSRVLALAAHAGDAYTELARDLGPRKPCLSQAGHVCGLGPDGRHSAAALPTRLRSRDAIPLHLVQGIASSNPATLTMLFE